MESFVYLADIAETAPSSDSKNRPHKSEKREERKQKLRELRKRRRKAATNRRRVEERSQRCQLLNSMTTEERIDFIRAERHEQENEIDIAIARLNEARDAGLLHLCISLDFMQYMSDKEKRSLANQLGYVFKSMLKNSQYKASIIVSSYDSTMDAHTQYFGVSRWKHLTNQSHLLELYSDRLDDIIVLSPDADVSLTDEEVHNVDHIFVIGGIVDRTVCKNQTRTFAQVNNLRSRKLPIRETLGPSSHPVLNINTVADILLATRFDEMSLREALEKYIPQRKQVFNVSPTCVVET